MMYCDGLQNSLYGGSYTYICSHNGQEFAKLVALLGF
jgi:hypothetical protein